MRGAARESAAVFGRNGGFDSQATQGIEGNAQGGTGIEESGMKASVKTKRGRAPKRDLFDPI